MIYLNVQGGADSSQQCLSGEFPAIELPSASAPEFAVNTWIMFAVACIKGETSVWTRGSASAPKSCILAKANRVSRQYQS